MKKLVKDEKGAALILALILLLIGGLLSAALLGHMGAGLLAGEVYERRTAELYAADAGVEDAIWKIQHQVDGVAGLTQCYQDWSYNITGADGGVAEVNDNRVEVTITLVNNLTSTYRVISTATGDGSGTKIDAYITATIVSGDYSGIMDHIITIAEDLTDKELADLVNDLKKVSLACREGCDEECEDGCGAVYDYYAIPEGCYGCGVVYNYPDDGWPTAALLADFYWEDVENEEPYGSDTIDLAGIDMEEGPLYRDGTLQIVNTSNTPATVTLNETIYITGDTLIGQTGKDFTLDLNGQAIFVSSDHTKEDDGKYALEVGGKCSIDGPGIIIAIGDIYFAPKGSVGSDGEPVFIFSVSGTTYLQPSGDFYGSVAGSFDAEIKSGESPTLTYPPGGFGDLYLNFPGFVEPNQLVYSIYSWEVSQQ